MQQFGHKQWTKTPDHKDQPDAEVLQKAALHSFQI